MRTHKLFGRLVCFLLVLTCLGAFASCAGTTPDAPSSTGSNEEKTLPPSTETEPETDADGYIVDALPEKLDFGRRTFNVLQWRAYQNEFYLEGDAKDSINEALYYRVGNAEERLNSVLNIEYENGDWSNMGTFVDKIYNDVNSQINHYDLVGQYSFAAPTAAMYGCYKNLTKAGNYLDLEKPWWDQDLIQSAQLADKTFFVTGDIAPTSIYQNFCLFVNLDMVEAQQYSVDDLYRDALDGSWTMEKLQEMTRGIYLDTDHDGVASAGDTYGLDVFDNPHYDAFFYACGMKVVERTENGFALTAEFLGQKATNLVDEMKAYIAGGDVSKTQNGGMAFSEGRAMFVLTTFNYPLTKLREAKFRYGVLPMPKYDEAQKDYAISLAAPYTVYSIPRFCSSAEQSGALMEVLASHAYRAISPVIYEETLKTKLAGTRPENAQIYDLIRQSKVYDVGRIYGNIMSENGSGASFAIFRNSVVGSYESWSVKLGQMKDTYLSQLKVIENAYAQLG